MKKLSIIAALALTACVETPDAPDGKQLFMDNCASCHGAGAKGDGEMSAALGKAAPDLTTLTARYNGTFPSDYVMSTIDGLARKSHFSSAMPEFGAGGMGDTVIVEKDGIGTPVPAELLALTEYLESVQE